MLNSIFIVLFKRHLNALKILLTLFWKKDGLWRICMFFLAILFYCIVSGRPTVSFYMHLQCGLKVENSTWNYEKYSTVGGFQQPNDISEKGIVQKEQKMQLVKNHMEKYLTLFPKLTERPKIKMCILILSTHNCCKTSEKNWQFWICISKRYTVVYS